MFHFCISSDFDKKSVFSMSESFAKVSFVFLANNFKRAEGRLSGSSGNAWLLFLHNV